MKLEMKVAGVSAKYGTWKPGDTVDMDEAEAMRFVSKGYAIEKKETIPKVALRQAQGDSHSQTFEEFCPLIVKKSKVDDFKSFADEKNIDLGEAETKQQMLDAIEKHWKETFASV